MNNQPDIETMQSELKEAGYQFLPEHFDGDSFSDFTGWTLAPDGVWIEGGEFSYKLYSDADAARQKANDSTIEKAYAHLQQQKELVALREFVADVANADFTASDLRTKGAEAYRKEARKLVAQYAKSE